MKSVALSKVVTNTVDILDLFLMEEELTEIVFIIYFVALVSMVLCVWIILFSYPQFPSLEIQIKLVIAIFIAYLLDQIG